MRPRVGNSLPNDGAPDVMIKYHFGLVGLDLFLLVRRFRLEAVAIYEKRRSVLNISIKIEVSQSWIRITTHPSRKPWRVIASTVVIQPILFVAFFPGESVPTTSAAATWS